MSWLVRPGFRRLAPLFVYLVTATVLALGFVMQARTVNQVKGTFCAWATVQVNALRSEPPTAERVFHLHQDEMLRQRLCLGAAPSGRPALRPWH